MKNHHVQTNLLVVTSTFPRWENDSEPAFVFELSKRLTDSFEITVLAPRSPGSKQQETMSGVHVIRFPYFFKKWENLATHSGGIINRLQANPLNYLLVPFFLLGLFFALFQLLRTRDFHLIHAHWIIPQGTTAVFARAVARSKIPLICTSHGGDLYALQARPLQWLKRWVIERCDTLTVVSNAMRKTVLNMDICPEKVKVISMGVDLAYFYTPDATVLRSSREILFVGRFVEKKGIHVLLDAMPKICDAYPDVHLSLAGAGPFEEQAKKLARHYHLSDHASFLGMLPQSELPRLYRLATMAVFPFIVAESGDQEGLGLVVVEAMGCGCPVIASDLPALRDTVDHGNTGILVNPGDADALAKAVIQLLGNSHMRSEMAANARLKVEKKFDWETISRKYEELYVKHNCVH